ncbi:hypothetical protein HG535_0C00180 [Zygotorulaspora mrakii]|uniref:nitric oxide dioxygenase n=1 Tax=Zygotorulaspora mrakii TaxID=42260 RepID=A0A7H9AZA9_ZYGMR|nr:uncharacterized protein HG535_0C00180 [Zygotorulaspora mrakii]QLG71671.1 hypothetical protein HG535_0C00180 [Zygotorulaspora mrakii]
MLSTQTRTIVKATVPVLEENGVTITKLFYKNMLGSHKELLNIFNRVNQAKGAQPTALATTVLAAAKQIDDLSVLLPHVEQIGHKHRALQIMPEHYPIVGENLLNAIKQVLGDAATPEIINAWAEAYSAIADIFISVEKKMYDEAVWPSWQPFEVVSREQVGSEIVEFTVKPKPASGIDLDRLPIIAGQYLTVKTHPSRHQNQYDALRHYSICSASTKDGLRFAVKLETEKDKPNGLVSEYLHKDVSIGDELLLSAPAGDFKLDEKLKNQNEIPLVLLAAGVGATPLLAMLEEQVTVNSKRPIIWIQSSFDESSLAFKKHVDEALQKASNSKKIVVYTESQSRIDDKFLKENVPAGADVYICGSFNFMQSMIDHFAVLKHQQDAIHYEPFGPKMATVKV